MNKLQSGLIFPFLRFFFKHLYSTLAWSYDLVANLSSMGQWWTWGRTVLPKLSSAPVLELGHGTGRLLQEACRQGLQVFAIDASRQMSAMTARRLEAQHFPLRIARARSQQLPFPDRHFATVYATFPSEYIFDPSTLLEAFRVLKPGGHLIVVGVAIIHGRSIADRLAGWLYAITGQSTEPGDQWREPLAAAGFTPRLERIWLPRAQVLHFVGVKQTA
ncbi:MAG: methyltransferase domain-containing protein [Anaerolineales bacterium]|jgi:ubiquinone/menaquinone biosynthesis C-methylase UbiE